MIKQVVVFFDYICPFCFIMKDMVERLERDFGVNAEWKGFQIHPEIPPQGTILEDLGVERERLLLAYVRAGELAGELGLKISFPTRISNSQLALQIGEFAKQRGKFREFHGCVFRAYWQEGVDIGNRSCLFEISKQIGLDLTEVGRYLGSPDAEVFLERAAEEAWEMGVEGIPTLLIGDMLRVEGPQPYEFLTRVVQRALNE